MVRLGSRLLVPGALPRHGALSNENTPPSADANQYPEPGGAKGDTYYR
jgi:hypothetical protein